MNIIVPKKIRANTIKSLHFFSTLEKKLLDMFQV